jgi:hypothetical protein
MTESRIKLPVTIYPPCEAISRYVSHYGLRLGQLENFEVLHPIYARTQPGFGVLPP